MRTRRVLEEAGLWENPQSSPVKRKKTFPRKWHGVPATARARTRWPGARLAVYTGFHPVTPSPAGSPGCGPLAAALQVSALPRP